MLVLDPGVDITIAEEPCCVPRPRYVVGEDSEGRQVRVRDHRRGHVHDGDAVIVEVLLPLVQVVIVLQQCGVQVLVLACSVRIIVVLLLLASESASIQEKELPARQSS